MEPIRVYDTTSTTGGYLAGLAHNTAGLLARYRREGQASWTTFSLVSATAGTFTSGGFVAASDGPAGAYELHLPNAAVAAGARWVEIELSGAANMLPVPILIELDAVDYQTARFGSPTATQTADAVRTELTTELGRIDAAISSRLAADDYETPDNAAAQAAQAAAEIVAALVDAGQFTEFALANAPVSGGGGVTIDSGELAAALYRKIAAGSVTVLERPAVADPLDVVNSADFAAQLYVPSAASSTLVFTIRRCADDVVAQLEADSYAGLTIAPGTFTADQAEVVRVSSERVDVGIAAAVLSQLAPGKYFAELRELTDGAAVRSLWEAALLLRRTAGRRIA
jgi:hypothetical protein